jgi:hypothetical protein
MIGGIGAGATAYSLFTYDNTTFAQLRVLGSGIVAGYGFYQWIQARNEINQLNLEGKTKGFVLESAVPLFTSHGALLALNFKF